MSGPGERRRHVADTGERVLPDTHRRELVAAEHLARYAWAAQAAAGRVALDAGCGVGYGTAMLARAGAVKAVGIDLSADAIADAAADFGDDASFEVGDLLVLPFQRASFGLVTCFEAIEHVVDPDRGLHELRRVMASDGLLLVSSPNRGVYPEGNPFHVHEYTTRELDAALRSRFEHVRLHHQEAHLATLVARADVHAASDPDAEITASVRRLDGGVEGQVTYTVAAASDAPLPELGSVAMLTGGQSLRTWLDPLLAWQRRAQRAEAEAAAMRRELSRRHFEHEKLAGLLATLRGEPQGRRLRVGRGRPPSG